jgi:predicted aspartyl protease
MSVPFDSGLSLVVVRAKLWGPDGSVAVRLALDTGSTSTLINWAPLMTIGYDPANAMARTQVATGSGFELVPRVTIDRIDALEHTRLNISVLCHTLPASTRVDGLLGLDLLRGNALLIDFRKGEITLI